MDRVVIAAIDELPKSKVAALKKRYRELFGEESKSSNKQFLFRRIAWRLQANAEGDLSERARRRASEIADDRDLRTRAPKEFVARPDSGSPSIDRTRPPKDGRLPDPVRCSPAASAIGRSSSRCSKMDLSTSHDVTDR